MGIVIGLTGGIGSGKSTVAEMYRALGATVIDADAIVHELQAAGSPLLARIAEHFGASLIREDGSLDRESLAARVFSDIEARERLNRMIHPLVIEELAQRLAAAKRRDDAVIVLDIPLLFEGRKSPTSSATRLPFDATVLVYVPEAMQIERLMARTGCERAEAERRIRAQMPIDEKIGLADYMIDNSGTRDDTERQVRETLYAISEAQP
jgi:dephospho-CoA kinase